MDTWSVVWAWVLAAAAASLFSWGVLLGDRPWGRLRCPRCWYQIAPGAGRRCPECGRAIGGREELLRTRRRWWTLGAAAVLLLGSYASWVLPRVVRDGWPAAVPTTALIVALPLLVSDQAPLSIGHPATPPPTRLRDLLYRELLDYRMRRGRLWDWQWVVLAEVCLASDAARILNQWSMHGYGYGAFLREAERQGRLTAGQARRTARLVTIRVDTRPAWPENVPICAKLVVRRWGNQGWTRCRFVPSAGGTPFELVQPAADWSAVLEPAPAWDDGLTEIPPVAAGGYTVVVEQAPTRGGPWRKLTTVHLDIPVSLARSPILRPIVSPEIERFLSERIVYRLALDPTGPVDLLFEGRTMSPGAPPTRATAGSGTENTVAQDELVRLLASRDDATLGLWIEVRDGDGVLQYVGRAWWGVERVSEGDIFLRPPANRVRLQPVDTRGETPPPSGRWTVRLTGDERVALRNFDCTAYWSGQVVAPLDGTGEPSRAMPSAPGP